MEKHSRSLRVYFQVFFIVMLALMAASCSGGGGSKEISNNLKVVAICISPNDKGLLLTKSKVAASKASAHSTASLSDSLMRVEVTGDITAVSFTVLNTSTGIQTTQYIPILDAKILTENFIGLKISDGRVGILNKTTGEVYDVSGIKFDELQMREKDLYTVDPLTGFLWRISLADPSLTKHAVNKPESVSTNTGLLSPIYSMLDSVSSPFKFFAFNQKPGLGTVWSPSFVFAQDYIMAMSGPMNSRVFLFREGEPAFDCETTETFTNVGGGGTGGVIQTPDKSLYQIRIVSNPVVSDYGDRLVKYNIGKYLKVDTGLGWDSCWGNGTETEIINLGPASNFTPSTYIYTKTKYKLSDIERYILDPTGFLRTYSDGSGGVTMDWTGLDLSDVPVNQSDVALVAGSTLYYLKNGDIYYQALASGAVPALYYSGLQVESFDVVNGQLLFSNSTGTYSVSQAGQTENLVNANVDLIGTVNF